jgi:hypothetical protein
LQTAAGSAVARGELGVPLRDAGQRGPDWYIVRKDEVQEPVWLEGGEEIDLYYRPGGNRFHAFPFHHEVEDAAVVRADYSGLGGGYAFRGHRPVRHEQDVQFPLSLQRFESAAASGSRDIWQWTPRPAEAWIEITPLLADDQKAEATYYFYDANWEPQKPVPILRLVAREWPAASSKALIQAWFKSPSTASTIVLPLSDVVTARNGVARPLIREIAPGVSIQLDAGFVDPKICNELAGRPQAPTLDSSTCYRIRLVERHRSQSADVSALKVFVPQGDRVRPRWVVRQFDQRHGLVVHSFYYDKPDNGLLVRLQGAAIGVASKQDAQAGAVRAPELVVEISESGNLLPLAGQWTRAE